MILGYVALWWGGKCLSGVGSDIQGLGFWGLSWDLVDREGTDGVVVCGQVFGGRSIDMDPVGGV